MIQVSDLNLIVIQNLINNGFLPESGNFDITEDLLYQHRQLYASFGGGKTNKYLKSRRYAGAGFIYLKKYRKIPAKEIKEGFVYLISNPSWPDKIKIGLTLDPKKRLTSYQTYDPYRSYKLESYEFVTNKQIVEQNLIKEFSTDSDLGEWVSGVEASYLIQKIRNNISLKEGELIFKDKNNVSLRLKQKVLFNYSYKKPDILGYIIGFKESGLEILSNGTKYTGILPNNVCVV